MGVVFDSLGSEDGPIGINTPTVCNVSGNARGNGRISATLEEQIQKSVLRTRHHEREWDELLAKMRNDFRHYRQGILP